jgi:hypothetical protein
MNNEPSTLPPPTFNEVPVVPTPNPRKRWRILAGAAVAVVAFAGIVTAVAANSEPKLSAHVPPGFNVFTPEPETIRVNYSMTIYDESCSYVQYGEYSGYDDIPWAEVEVFDGSGNLLGFGSLDGGIPYDDSDEECVYNTSFDVERSDDGMYRVTVGNEHRGFLNYTEADAAVSNVLNVVAELGG